MGKDIVEHYKKNGTIDDSYILSNENSIEESDIEI